MEPSQGTDQIHGLEDRFGCLERTNVDRIVGRLTLALYDSCQQIELGNANKDSIIADQRNAVLHRRGRDPEVVSVDLVGQGMAQAHTGKTQPRSRPGKTIIARGDGRASYALVELKEPGLSPTAFESTKVEFSYRLDRDDKGPSGKNITVTFGKRDASGREASREDAGIDDDRGTLTT